MYPNIFISDIAKRRIAQILVIILIIQSIILITTGCALSDEYTEPQTTDDFVEYNYLIKDENINTKQIALYYPDKNYESLVRIVSEARVYEGTNEISVIINKWLSNQTDEESEYINPFNSAISLDWVTVSRNLATINLKGNFYQFDDIVYYSGIVSLVNTVCELNYIEYVEILLNGSQLPNIGLLKTPMTKVNEKLKLSYLEHLDTVSKETETAATKENTIFYYLDIKSNYLIADVSNVVIAKDNAVEEIFGLLKSGPNYDSGMKSCIPQSVVLNSGTIEDENGETVLTLRLESSNIETFENKVRYMLCGGLTLTMLSYFREVDMVRILINEQPVLENPLLRRDDFKENVGHLVSLYMPNKDYSLLMEVQTAVSQDDYNNPWQIINEIINYERSFYSYTRLAFPPNTEESDILEVVVYNKCCIINMSDNLMASLQNVSQKQQRLFVYSIVNTLTKLDNISSVQFIVNGVVVEKISDTMYIETPIIKNPDILFQ